MADHTQNPTLYSEQLVMRIALSMAAAFLIMNLATFVTYGSLAVIM